MGRVVDNVVTVSRASVLSLLSMLTDPFNIEKGDGGPGTTYKISLL
jgi:hypothetical protein